MIDATRMQLAKAARQRIEAAYHLCPSNGASRPSVSAYLAHVGLECLLKAWLLYKNNASDTRQFRNRIPEAEADQLFSGKGHDLKMLAEKALLKRHLTASDEEELLRHPAWARLAATSRPYDVRYGIATVPVSQAREEVQIAMSILKSMEKALR
jgi:hypothetical protein